MFRFALFLTIIFTAYVHANSTKIILKQDRGVAAAGYILAKEKGYFSELGLDVSLIFADEAGSTISQVLNSEGSYGVSDPTLVVEAAAGKPVVLLAQIFQKSPLVFIRPINLARGPIEKVYILEDIAVPKAYLEVLKSQLGASIVIEFVTIEQALAAVKDKSVDYILINILRHSLSFRESSLHFDEYTTAEFGIELYGDNLFSTVKEVSSHPERALKIRSAVLKGWEFLFNHLEEATLIIENYLDGQVPYHELIYQNLLASTLIQSDNSELGDYSYSRIERIASSFTKGGLLPLEYFFLPHFVQTKLETLSDRLLIDELKIMDQMLASSANKFTLDGDLALYQRYQLIEKHYRRVSEVLMNRLSKDQRLSFQLLSEHLFDVEQSAFDYYSKYPQQARISLYEQDYLTTRDALVSQLDSLKFIEEENTAKLNKYLINNLTSSEREYVDENIIQVAAIDWKPFVAVLDSGQVRGRAETLLSKISSYTGLKFRFHQMGWDEALVAHKKGKVDIIAALPFNANLSKQGLFIGEYAVSARAFYVLDGGAVADIEEIPSRKVAIFASQFEVSKITESYPLVEFVIASSIEQMFELLQEKVVDAIYVEQGVVDYYSHHFMTPHLRVIKPKTEDLVSIQFFLSEHDKTLAGLFRKGFLAATSTGNSEVTESGKKLAAKDSLESIANRSVILIAVAVIIAIICFAMWVSSRLSKSQINKSYGNRVIKGFIGACWLIVLIIVAATSWYDNRMAERAFIENQRSQLTSLINVVSERLVAWTSERIDLLELLARHDELVSVMTKLTNLVPDETDSEFLRASTRLDSWVEQQSDLFRDDLYHFVDTDLYVINSANKSLVGTQFEGVSKSTVIYAKLLAGISQLIPIYNNKSGFELFAAIPVMNRMGSVIGFLFKSVSQDERLWDIAQASWFDNTGDVYFTSKYGEQLTPSRIKFEQVAGNLSGLIQFFDGDGWSFTEPVKGLVAMANELPANDTQFVDSNFSGYTDKNGDTVYGVWKWLPSMQVGVIVEVEKTEARHELDILQRNLNYSSVVIILFVSLMGGFSFVISQKLNRLLRRSNEELEHQVEQRTQELINLEARSRQLLENAGEGIIATDEAGHITLINPIAQQFILSNLKQSLVSAEFTYPIQQPEQWALFLENIDCPRNRVELCLYNENNFIYLDIHSEPILINGSYSGAILTLRDISEDKAAGQALKAQSEKLEAILSTSPVGVALIQDGVIQFTNEQGASSLGYEEGCNSEVRFVRQMSRVQAQTQLDEVGMLNAFQTQIYDVNDRIRDILLYCYLIDVAGQKMLLEWSIDISEQVNIRKELEKAKDDAENANRIKSSFVANISHEIRTPLHAIAGIEYLLEQTKLSEKQRLYISKLRMSTDILSNIVNDVLDLSKIESGKLELDNDYFSLNQVFEQLFDVIMFKANEKRVTVHFDYDLELPALLYGDMQRIKQVLINIGFNAIKFTEPQVGEIWISATFRSVNELNLILNLEVRDNGIGMDSTQIKQLFQPFSQADVSTTRKYGGTGLGLSISKQLVELMGGEISAVSELCKGSTFTIQLPLSACQTEITPVQCRIQEQGFSRAYIEEDNALLDPVKTLLNNVGIHLIDIHKKKADDDSLVIISLNSAREGCEYTGNKLVLISDYADLSEALDVKSKLGAAAVIYLPLLPLRALELLLKVHVMQPLNQADAKLEQSEIFTDIHFLVAEDNTVNQELVRDILELHGGKVTIVCNGQEAVNMVSQFDFDIVIMDGQMPVKDGYEAALEIANLPKEKIPPVVAMTASVLSEDRVKAKRAKMVDLIPKPVDVDSMIIKLCTLVGRDYVNLPVSNKPSDVDLFPLMKHIDIRAGLSNLKSTEIYKGLLSRFKKSLPTTKEQLENAKGDWKAVQQISHTVKGVAGNLGAMELSDIASHLEKACFNPSNERFELLHKFEVELTLVRDELNLYLHDEADSSNDTPSLNEEEISKLSLLFKEQLANYDPKSIETWRLIKGTYNLSESEVKEITEALDDFEFDEAAKKLSINQGQ